VVLDIWGRFHEPCWGFVVSHIIISPREIFPLKCPCSRCTQSSP
jgi:hypothetical protein